MITSSRSRSTCARVKSVDVVSRGGATHLEFFESDIGCKQTLLAK